MTIQIAYGNTTRDFDALPEQSRKALASRGLTHFLGSEQASKVGPNSSWFGKFEKDNGRKPTEAELEAQKAANLATALEALDKGTIGTARGPRLDPVEAEMERMAERKVWDTLAGGDMCKKNKKPADDDSFTFADGSTFTFAQLVERQYEKNGDSLRAAATKKVEAERKAKADAERKAQAVKAQGPIANPAALGL
jgi:hypothetical protein